jgi:hypothetical protein
LRDVRLPGRKGYRIPDGLDDAVLAEVKNVQYLELTGRVEAQFNTFAQYARLQTPPLRFVLHVRSYTEIGPKMAQFIRTNGVDVVSLSDVKLVVGGLKELGKTFW